jgi:hypothetical protein
LTLEESDSIQSVLDCINFPLENKN